MRVYACARILVYPPAPTKRDTGFLCMYVSEGLKHAGRRSGRDRILAHAFSIQVDLGGSERYQWAHAERTNRETVAINQSLSCLASCIAALTGGKQGPPLLGLSLQHPLLQIRTHGANPNHD